MQLLRDYRHPCRGIWGHPTNCRILAYAPTPGETDQRPIIVCEELKENRGTSATTVAEVSAAKVIAWHLPHLLDADAEQGQPVRWIEPYPPEPGMPGEWDEVTFTPVSRHRPRRTRRRADGR